jgi:hypothetical protein
MGETSFSRRLRNFLKMNGQEASFIVSAGGGKLTILIGGDSGVYAQGLARTLENRDVERLFRRLLALKDLGLSQRKP